MKGWLVTEESFSPQELHHKETVFTVGNGYLSTRGAFEESYPGAWPATLIHGVYDAVPVHHVELANAPHWPMIQIRVDGELFRLDRGQVQSYRRQLDLRRGLLIRDVRWTSPGGRTLDLHFERLASLADPHLLAVRCQVTALEAGSHVEVQAGLHGYPDNLGVMHWTEPEQGHDQQTAWLGLRTRQSAIGLGMATRLDVAGIDGARPQVLACPGAVTLAVTYEGPAGQTVTLDKIVAVATSRDVPEPVAAARDRLALAGGYDALLAAHEAAWVETWEASDVLIEGADDDQVAVRYNLFQTLIAAPRHDDRVSISAKTLSGFGYRGHVFWDTEIFALPFLTYTQPHIARNLLSYRYHTLAGARLKARAMGYEGAMVAWESADTGDEVTPKWVPDPRGEELVRIWPGEIELHITSDVAYATWQYWQATGDDEWMRDQGAEIVLDGAVFWGSRVEHDEERDRYTVSGVIGPDEYHDHVDNNAFTNRMVQWHLETALVILAWLRREYPARATELEKCLDLSAERQKHWANVAGCMFVPHDPETGLIEQFEGFFELEDVNLDDYEPRNVSMHAILGIEGANRAQAIKQADVLMLLYLLQHEKEYDRETLQVNWDYYNPRTDHTYGSSLGPAIHAILACEMGEPEEAYEHFRRSAYMDLENLRNNTPDGIHAAAAGGLWQALVFGFGGVRVADDGPRAEPRLPAAWTRLKFRLQHRGQWYQFDIKGKTASRKRAGARRKAEWERTANASDRPIPDSQLANSLRPDIRGAIFDLDGVLTDTSELHYQSWQRLADEEGILFDRQANEALRGIARRDSLLLVLAGRPASEEQIQEMMARKNRYYQDSVESLTDENLLAGALDLLRELRRAGILIAIGSASKNARRVIERLRIGHLVDVIADGQSVDRHKPAPDLFLVAAQRLGVPAGQCVVFEDAESGVEAALAAGMWAVGLGPKDRVGRAHLVLPGLEGVRWADIHKRLAQEREAKG